MQLIKRAIPWRLLVASMVFMLVAAACGDDDEPTATPAPTPAPTAAPGTDPTMAPEPTDYGPPETAEITVANRLPDLGSNTQTIGGERKGFFALEGLKVETINVEDVRAALASGSAQVVPMEPGILFQARNEGLDFVAISGHRCGQLNTFAIQADIPNAAALRGKDVLVGGVPGTPDADLRLALLKINGWDLEPYYEDINFVSVPGGSNAWTELFYEGQLAITPFFGRHLAGMEEFGANIAVNMIVGWPDEFWVTTREFLDANPNTIGRFVRGLLRTSDWALNPANDADVVTTLNDIATDLQKDVGVQATNTYTTQCRNNVIDEDATNSLLAFSGIAPDAGIDVWADLSFLMTAQAEFGYSNVLPQGTITDPFSAPAQDRADYGPPETTEIVMANRLPNLTSNATTTIAEVAGFAGEEGLTIETVIVEEVRAALVSGAAHIASLEPNNMMQARNEGIDLVAVAGFRCNSNTTIAVQADIDTVADLIGKDVLIGGVPGTPDADFRLGMLALGGFDLRGVEGINFVTIPGGSNAWTEQFWAGNLAITPFFARHTQRMIDFGANIAVDSRVEWPDDFFVMTREFVEENPNTVGRLVRSLVRSADFWLDPANKDEVLNFMGGAGFDNEAEIAAFDLQKLSFCSNLYFNDELTRRGMRGSGFAAEDIDAFEDYAVQVYLLNAQAELGLDNSPGPYVQLVPGLGDD